MNATDRGVNSRKFYKREWYQKNKDKQKQYNERYWEKKLQQSGA
jgi:hypothetical protein